MKISQSPDILVGVGSTGAQGSNSGTAATGRKGVVQGTAGSGGSSSSVSVSSLAQSLSTGTGLEGGSDVDMDKVQTMRAAIQNGSFQVNAGAIADKLLSNAQDLMRSQSES
ncbi:MAG: flagellar biosynthesis anti-sigma factor FlgM [Curvibacter sp.]|nr:flagellar biosynthesis anti-sigma factor FlgM [Curvibacter sp.]